MVRMLTIAMGLAMLSLTHAPALAGKKDDAWARCIAQTMPQSASKWLSMPKTKGRAWSDFVLHDRNYTKGRNAELSTTDEFRSEFAGLRLEAACKEQVAEELGKAAAFRGSKVRQSFEKLSLDLSGTDQLDPAAHVCIAYDQGLIQAMVMGVGPGEEVREKNPSADLRCFTITDDGDLIEEAEQSS